MSTPDKYQAEFDAQTLARAEEIKADKARLEAAKAKAGELVDEQAARLAGLKRVAGKASTIPPAPVANGPRVRGFFNGRR